MPEDDKVERERQAPPKVQQRQIVCELRAQQRPMPDAFARCETEDPHPFGIKIEQDGQHHNGVKREDVPGR